MKAQARNERQIIPFFICRNNIYSELISKLLKSRQTPNLRPAQGVFSAVTFPPSHKAMARQVWQPPQTTFCLAVVLLFNFVLNDF